MTFARSIAGPVGVQPVDACHNTAGSDQDAIAGVRGNPISGSVHTVPDDAHRLVCEHAGPNRHVNPALGSVPIPADEPPQHMCEQSAHGAPVNRMVRSGRIVVDVPPH